MRPIRQVVEPRSGEPPSRRVILVAPAARTRGSRPVCDGELASSESGPQTAVPGGGEAPPPERKRRAPSFEVGDESSQLRWQRRSRRSGPEGPTSRAAAARRCDEADERRCPPVDRRGRGKGAKATAQIREADRSRGCVGGRRIQRRGPMNRVAAASSRPGAKRKGSSGRSRRYSPESSGWHGLSRRKDGEIVSTPYDG